MCYNLQQKKTKGELEKRYKAKAAEGLEIPQYYSVSGFTHPNLAVLTAQEPEVIQAFNWGLIPFWTKDKITSKDFAKNNLNAKSETIYEKKSFAPSIKAKRCIIPVTGFFEWRDINKQKYPYMISLKDDEIFSLGGIYDTWKDKVTGEEIHSFSIITTSANSLMAKIHNLKLRMPFIIPKEKESLWLKPELTELDIKDLMQPLDESLMHAHTISKRITSRTENPNDPATCEPYEYPELV
jgi:putative SOS response-associated peptidase YedK